MHYSKKFGRRLKENRSSTEVDKWKTKGKNRVCCIKSKLYKMGINLPQIISEKEQYLVHRRIGICHENGHNKEKNSKNLW